MEEKFSLSGNLLILKEFLQEKATKYATKKFDYDDIKWLIRINKNDQNLKFDTIDTSTLDQLYALADDSKLDDKTLPKEIDGKYIKLNILLENAIEDMICELQEAFSVKMKLKHKLHKLIIYTPGDFFKEHIDSIHWQENMIMTFSLNLPLDLDPDVENKLPKKSLERLIGGELTFDKQIINDDWRGTLFYNDVKHHVEPITQGSCVVLTFDVLQDGPLTPTKEDEHFLKGLMRLKELNYKRVGFLMQHFTEDVCTKGYDLTIYNLAKHLNKNVTFMQIMNKDGKIYHADLLNLVKEFSGFKIYSHEESKKVTEDKLEITCPPKYQKSNKLPLDQKYFVGDIAFIQTDYVSSSSLYTGFDSTIYTSLVLVFDL